MHKTDADILYHCYLDLAERLSSRKRKIERKRDRTMIRGIAPSASLMITRLTSTDIVSLMDIQKYVLGAKGLFFQYCAVKNRNPDCVSSSLDQMMETLLCEICRHEADMIRDVRLQEPCGKRIDLQVIFDVKKNLKRLGNDLARTIVTDVIHEEGNPVDYFYKFYVTNTGSKYHRNDCSYCGGRDLISASYALIKSRRLTPCRCLTEMGVTKDYYCVTAFVDESIHSILWDEEGCPGKAGSYSYIICRGNLESEKQISGDLILSQGVDYTSEHDHVNRITETAIGKVLLTLFYDFEYYGNVCIYTDNQSVVESWNKLALNSRLSKNFLSVKVRYIPRDKNTKADQLGRSRIHLDIPASSYHELVKLNAYVKELETKVSRLEISRWDKAELTIMPRHVI